MKKFTKQEKSWIMYDWANSVFATIMMAAVFPIFFTSMAGGEGTTGSYWWGIGSSVSALVVAVLAPIVGAFADFKGYKKRIFSVFLIIGLAGTLYCALTGDWRFLLLGYTLGYVGFAGANVLYDSFLTDVSTEESMDHVSSYGYAMGYIGGSTIPFLVSIALMLFGGNFGIDAVMAMKISIVITVLWWGLFSIPFFKNVKQTHYIERPEGSVLKSTFRSIGRTAKNIFANKTIFVFILAYFFYIDGVGTVMKMATAYGTELGLGSTGMILALLVTQIVAVPCSIAFSHLSKKLGSLKLIVFACCMYLFICVLGFVMGFGLEEGFLTLNQSQTLFWILAFCVGTVQGGIQAISRSYYGKLVPPENSGEYFGFFDIFGKFAAVIGPALYALAFDITGRSSFSILSIILLFVVALIILGVGRKHLVK